MENNFKYIVYLTTNIKNNKIYVGVHKTKNNKFDGYIGCGVNIYNPSSYKHSTTVFQHAVKKYGIDNFKRVILSEFDNLEDALKFESLVVDDKFIKRNDTYNTIIGGNVPPIKKIECYKYDENGKYINSYDSILEASESINVSRSSLDKAIKLKYKSGGFYWSLNKENLLDISSYSKSQKIIIHAYNLKGLFVESFNSLSEAVIKYNYCLSRIQKSIKYGYRCGEHYFSTDFSDLLSIKNFSNNTNKQEIHRYSLQGDYIDSFKSVNEAKKILNISLHNLNNSIKFNTPRNNYLWSYIKYDKLESVKSIGTANPVIVTDLNNNFIEEFKTVRECRKKYPSCIYVLKGIRKQSKGMLFKYKVNDIV